MRSRFTIRDIVPCALLGLCCIWLFREVLVEGQALYGADFNAFYLGMKHFLYREIQTHHSIPFWNPYMLGGMPFLAHFESTIFYPLDLLFWVLPPEKAYGYTVFFHLLLAGLFMVALARSLGTTRAGSLAAGGVFAFNGYIMPHIFLGQMGPMQSYLWLPAVLYFVNRAQSSEAPFLHIILAGLLWGVQILAGAPQDAFYTFLAVLFFMICNVSFGATRRRAPAGILGMAVALFLAGAGTAAIQIIPAFELVGESVRASLDSFEMVTQGSFPPEGAITLLMPHFFGHYANDSYWVKDVPWSMPQYGLYVGILPLFLIFFVSWKDPTQRRLFLFAGTLSLLALLLAFGRHTPLYSVAFWVPGFDRFRAPSKVLVLWVFALSLLAGKGMDGLLVQGRNAFSKRLVLLSTLVLSMALLNLWFHQEPQRTLQVFSAFLLPEAIPQRMGQAAWMVKGEFHRLTILSSLSLLLILWHIRRSSSRPLAGLLMCALLIFDLAHINEKAVQGDQGFHQQLTSLKGNLDLTIGKDRGQYRVGSFTSTLSPNTEMYLGYQTVGGFTALFLHRYYEYINRYTEGTLPEGWQVFFYGRHTHGVLMDLLNVKYELSHMKGDYYVRDSCLPRAFVVPRHKVLPEGEVLDHLVRPDFDPTACVLLEEDPSRISPPADAPQQPPDKARAEISLYRPDQIILDVKTPFPGYLFLSEVFYPGWKAYVDEKPQRILRGNYLFRVVQVPSGNYSVQLVYDPLSIRVGAGISLFSLLCMLGIVVCAVKRRAGAKSAAPSPVTIRS